MEPSSEYLRGPRTAANGPNFFTITGANMNTKKILQAIGTSIVIGCGLAVLSIILKTIVLIYSL